MNFEDRITIILNKFKIDNIKLKHMIIEAYYEQLNIDSNNISNKMKPVNFDIDKNGYIIIDI